MDNFDQVLARIQNQLEAMKKSLVHRREEYSEVVRQEQPGALTPGETAEEPTDREKVPDPRLR
jgi:hypothetical protein